MIYGLHYRCKPYIIYDTYIYTNIKHMARIIDLKYEPFIISYMAQILDVGLLSEN